MRQADGALLCLTILLGAAEAFIGDVAASRHAAGFVTPSPLLLPTGAKHAVRAMVMTDDESATFKGVSVAHTGLMETKVSPATSVKQAVELVVSNSSDQDGTLHNQTVERGGAHVEDWDQDDGATVGGGQSSTAHVDGPQQQQGPPQQQQPSVGAEELTLETLQASLETLQASIIALQTETGILEKQVGDLGAARVSTVAAEILWHACRRFTFEKRRSLSRCFFSMGPGHPQIVQLCESVAGITPDQFIDRSDDIIKTQQITETRFVDLPDAATNTHNDIDCHIGSLEDLDRGVGECYSLVGHPEVRRTRGHECWVIENYEEIKKAFVNRTTTK
ncbi:hypothetical protein JKP88DRAFT_247368 [Tribonema minus]|uniref:Uncharacterized protein n=1 Tax=Tribonema minus TaxID=303371 RepID=A0A835YQH6_9STRA|nr:hypothetical protein JKP88DRAFT_247368 [Tribonema minus]